MCWHYDQTTGKNVKEVNILSAWIQYGEVAIPIAFECVKKGYILWYENKKVKRMSDRSKNEMFRDIIDQAIKNVLKYAYVLADSWYASKENMKHIKSKGKRFVLALKSNRLIALNKKDTKRGEFKKLSELELGENTAVGAYIKERFFPCI